MIIICITLLIVIYLYATRNHNYWAKRNIKYDHPIPLFGNHIKKILGLKSGTQLATDIYYKYPKEKVVGCYTGTTPELLIRDPDIIRTIFSTDFSSFYTRGIGKYAKPQPLLMNLFHGDGDFWKLMRQRLTPAFTTAKLKSMCPLIIKCAEKLEGLGDDIVRMGGECDVRDLMAKFTTEFIGACGLGIEMDTIKNEDSFFRNLGRTTFTRSKKDVFTFAISETIPELSRMIPIFDKKLVDVFMNSIVKVFEQRNFKPSGRNDFVDLLLDLSAKGTIVGESIIEKNQDGTPKIIGIDMDLNCMIGQVFIFFAAGFETSASSTSYTLYQLALNPDIQIEVQKEIDKVLAKYNGKLCYEVVSELSQLEMAYKESLRMFPPLGTLNRICTKKFTFPQLGITIDPGVKITIPLQAIQNDAKYFENPDRFLPARWADDKMKNVQKYTYMPFGEGPRNCIGSRLGHMQSLAGLAALLQRFTVEPSADTPSKLTINPYLHVVQAVKNGIPLRLKLRSKN